MEFEDIRHLPSVVLQKPDFSEQLQKIAEIAAVAQAENEFAEAHDPQIIRAIEIVEKFLRDSGRICYGGQALNAHLPDSVKFYNPERTIPDYDFFTPDQDKDLAKLIRMLKKAGFQEIGVRLGIHEGTLKVYVNYTPIADLTEIDSNLYELFYQRKFIDKGISYLDADSLRMLIYLELSRPKGEVERWPKVYERLLLLDEFVPFSAGFSSRPNNSGRIPKNYLKRDEYRAIFRYIVKTSMIFAGADLKNLYEKLLKSSHHLKLSHRYPITAYSRDLDGDSRIVVKIIEDYSNMEHKDKEKQRAHITTETFQGINGDMLPPMKIIFKNGHPVVLLIQETACHSFYNWKLPSGENLKIASVDTLVTLFFALGLRGEGTKLTRSVAVFLGGFESLAKQIISISKKTRSLETNFPFPFVSLDCEGYQRTYKSLLKDKLARMKRTTIRQKLAEIKKRVLNSRFNQTLKSTRKRLDATAKPKN